MHRTHQDLPVECSQLTHSLPQLMNQAATNFSFVNSLIANTDTNKTNTNPPIPHLSNVHSSNPTVNIDPLQQDNAKDFRSSFLLDDAKSLSDLYSSNTGALNKILTADLMPTNPFSIPTTTCIVNASTANLSQAQRRARASTAVSILLKLSRGRLNPPALPPQHSLYLAHLAHALPFAGSSTTSIGGANIGTEARGSLWDSSAIQLQHAYIRKKMVVTPANDVAKMSKWLSSSGGEQDELVQRALKRCHVMTLGHVHHDWNWDLIMALLRWPSEQLQKISGASYRLFVKRLVHFYKPSAELFSKTPSDHPNARKEAETLMLLLHFLLRVPENDSGRHLEELLMDLLSHLKLLSVQHPAPDLLLSPTALTATTAHYYFLMVGVLSRSSQGHRMLEEAGLLEQLHAVVVTRGSSEVYVKLIASSLDYTIDGVNR